MREGYRPDDIAIVGDSAGAGLALGALFRIRDGGGAMPAAAAFISPWFDPTLALPVDETLAERDPVLSRRWLARCASAYRGPSLLDVSPVGLPRMLVVAASDDRVLGDARAFCDRAVADGASVEGVCYDGLCHDFPIHAGLLSEAEHAIDAVVAFVRDAARSG